MNNKGCMVTGHRQIDAERIQFVKKELRNEIILAIKDGYTYFISGFAEGVDLLFAEIIVELKETYQLKLETAIPYRGRLFTNTYAFQSLIARCDVVSVISEEYFSSCFMKRNRFMVDKSERVIAVYDGRGKGGTFATIRYANSLEKTVKLIKG